MGPEFEVIHVVVGQEDQPILAVAAKRTIELYLFAAKSNAIHPAQKLAGIRLLHSSISAALKRKGYVEANAFLPPQLALSFGTRLSKTFGWLKNWQSFCIHF